MTETPTATGTPKGRSPSRWKYRLLVGLVLLVVALWSAYWAIGRGMAVDILRNTIEVAKIEGGRLDCGDQSLGGYPFRFELRCAPLDVAAVTGERLSLGGLRAVALAYNPRQLIVEADAPARLVRSAGPAGLAVDATWRTARSSARLGDETVARMDLVVEAPAVDIALEGAGAQMPFRVAADRAELYLRQSPEVAEDVDLAVRLAAVSTLPSVPVVDLFADMTIVGAAPLLGRSGGDWRALLASREALAIDRLVLSSGKLSLQASGALWLDEAGRLTGSLPLTVAGVDQLAQALAPFFPPASTVPATLQGALIGFGSPTALDGAPAVTVPLRFEGGVARVGLIPIGRLGPLM